MSTQVEIPQVKMGGQLMYYFPEFPDHKLNGMYAYGAGRYEGEVKGKKARKIIYGLKARLQDVYIRDEVYITPDMFGAEQVLVKSWAAGDPPEYFYLIK